ncbi:caspase, EACC1-associated type [Streptomyces lushanensis]|uniref:caspase, EACC1-associated type n=1 Tax=Streptomyces lushanensis TaxID=1434255 RepID=UPI0008336FC5|nr:caspase family protein [Streptomyces lushanensis]
MRLPDPARSRAVLIGVDRYKVLHGLPTVSNNLDRLAELFTDSTVWGLPPEHCAVLRNPSSTDEVLDAVHRAAVEAEDALVVYFAGHGLLAADTTLHLALPDAHHEQLYRAVDYKRLRRELTYTCTAAGRVVILDCCYSGSALAEHMGAPGGLPDEAAAVEGTYVMTATAATRLALAPRDEHFTAFTGELVTALDRGIAGAPALLRMDVLFRHIRGELARKKRPVPRQFAGDEGHRIALARNRGPWGDRDGGPDESIPGARPPETPEAPVPRAPVRESSTGWIRSRAWPVSRRFLRRPRGRFVAAAAVMAGLAVPVVPHFGDAQKEPPGIGDHRTADPCSLTDPDALTRFGTARLDRGYGNWDRCDVLVDTGDGEPVDVVVDFDKAGAPGLSGPRRTEGALDVVDGSEETGACGRTLLPAADKGVAITITAKRDEGTARLCDIAGTAADSAIRIFNRDGVGRRSPALPAASLGRHDACALLSARKLGIIPGIDAQEPDVGFGNWECEWSSTTGPLWVELRFDRGRPLTSDDGSITRIGGRQAIVQPRAEGTDTCLVRVVHRSYGDQNGDPAIETLNLTVGGDPSQAELRKFATELATAAVQRL